MASNFSRKLKAKNGNVKELNNIIKDLNDIPDNGVLDEVKARHEQTVELDNNDKLEISSAKTEDYSNISNISEQIIKPDNEDVSTQTSENDTNNINQVETNELKSSSIKKNDGDVSYQKAPFPVDKYEDDSKGTVYWSCRLDEKAIEKFELTVFMNDTSAKELINRLISAEKAFYDNHKELITMDIIKANIKNKYIYDDSKITKGFTLYPNCKDILNTYPKRYGMTMTAFIEYIINKYCSED